MRHKTIILFVVFVLLRSSSSEILLEDDPNHYNELAEFAAKTFWNECTTCKLTLIIYLEYDRTVDLFFSYISQKPYGMSIFAIQLDNFTMPASGEYPNHHPDMTIVFLNGEYYKSSDEVIFVLELFPLCNIRGKFLVVASDVPEDDDEWIESSFAEFWDVQALRVLICFWRDGLKLFSYNPFLDNFGYDVTDRTDLSEIFAHKIRNMHGYPIKLYHIDTILKERAVQVTKNGETVWVGFDAMYTTTMVETLNASMVVHRVSEDFDEAILKNGDLDTPFSEVMSFFASVYDFDILMNAARAYTDNDLDKACLYERDNLLIVVPKGRMIPHYLLIFQIVNYDVWCASLGSLLAVSVTTLFIRKYASQRLDAMNIFLDNYRILLTESPPDRPRQQQERLLFVLWVLHCIVFATLFQTIFMSALVVPRYYPDIDTFEDLHKAQMKVYTGEYIRIQIVKGMQGENKHFLDLLKSVPKEVSTFSESMDWIVNYRQDNGFIISQEHLYELKVLDKEAAQGAYHVMTTSAMPNALCYCVRRHKLFYDEVHAIILRIQDTGLNIHWRDFNYGLVKDRLDSNSTDTHDSDEQMLDMAHLQSAFILLFVGYILAILSFCCELIYRRMCKRNQDIV